MYELALFAGAGGGILGGALLGWSCIGAVEVENYPRRILLHRQADGILPRFPIWDDVRTFDGHPWRGLVDVVSGGFPCQDISCAGKGAGLTGARSGLWSEMHRIIGEVRPRYAFMENSPMLTSRGLGRVLGDLAEIGYDAAWMCLSAADCGAPHRRERIWILAEAGERVAGNAYGEHDKTVPEIRGGQTAHTHGICKEVPDTDLPRREAGEPCPQQDRPGQPMFDGAHFGAGNEWWSVEPNVGRVAHGVAARVDRLKAIGNGQAPIVAARAFLTLQRELERLKHYG